MSRSTTGVPQDPLDWRPQLPLPSRRPREIRNAILEPEWQGLHVLVHHATAENGEPRLRIIDDEGDDATADEPEVVDALLAAVSAVDCILDGFLTDQAGRTGEGTFQGLTSRGSAGLIRPATAQLDIAGPASEEEELPVSFVAIDILRVDGQSLLDVPLLERKRLLESVVAPGDRVRVSPYTQPPVQPWLATWKSAGFRGVVLKAANSRYVPSSETEEWTVVSEIGGRR